MPPKRGKDSEKTGKRKKSKKSVYSDSEYERTKNSSDKSDQEVVFSPVKNITTSKDSEKQPTDRSTVKRNVLGTPKNKSSSKKNDSKQSKESDQLSQAETESTIISSKPSTSVDGKGEAEVETELDYEDDTVDQQGVAQANEQLGADSDSSANPRDYRSTESEETSSDSSEPKRKKSRKKKRKSKKHRKGKAKRRRRSYSSSSSSTSSSSSSSSEERKKKRRKSKAKRKRKSRSRSRSSPSDRKEDHVTMTKEQFSNMQSLYEKMERFYNEHQQQTEQSVAGETTSINNSNNVFTAIPGLKRKGFREKPQAKAIPSETTILSRMIKPNPGGKSPDQIDRLLCNLRPHPGNLEPRSSSDSELFGKRLSDERMGLLTSSDEIPSTFISEIKNNGKKQTPPEDRLTEAAQADDWQERVEDARKRADRMIRDAELNKAEIIKPPGGSKFLNIIDQIAKHPDTDRCDELASTTSAHVDQTTREKVERGQFVELHKLRPIEVLTDEANKGLKLTNDDGDTYYIPSTASKDNGPASIYNFKTWRQCFIVYLEIYATANPTKAGEMIDYLHAIEEAASIYVWDNVAKYDRLFRLNMSKFPHREWSKRHQKHYESSMKDHIAVRNLISQARRINSAGSTNSRKPCWRFNKHGKCFLGEKCDQEHKCNKCGLHNHGGINCLKGKKEKPATESKTDKHDKK